MENESLTSFSSRMKCLVLFYLFSVWRAIWWKQQSEFKMLFTFYLEHRPSFLENTAKQVHGHYKAWTDNAVTTDIATLSRTAYLVSYETQVAISPSQWLNSKSSLFPCSRSQKYFEKSDDGGHETNLSFWSKERGNKSLGFYCIHCVVPAWWSFFCRGFLIQCFTHARLLCGE